MNNTFTITADVDTNSADALLGLEVWVDNNLMQTIDPVVGPATVSVEINDSDDSERELKFVLKNKTQDHTKIDEAGNILTDCCICIGGLSFDEIDLGQIFIEQAVYEHNFNVTDDTIQDQFYGEMGCNGTVTLSFTTPIYLWLLENM
jgi:hypothetical protein